MSSRPSLQRSRRPKTTERTLESRPEPQADCGLTPSFNRRAVVRRRRRAAEGDAYLSAVRRSALQRSRRVRKTTERARNVFRKQSQARPGPAASTKPSSEDDGERPVGRCSPPSCTGPTPLGNEAVVVRRRRRARTGSAELSTFGAPATSGEAVRNRFNEAVVRRRPGGRTRKSRRDTRGRWLLRTKPSSEDDGELLKTADACRAPRSTRASTKPSSEDDGEGRAAAIGRLALHDVRVASTKPSSEADDGESRPRRARRGTRATCGFNEAVVHPSRTAEVRPKRASCCETGSPTRCFNEAVVPEDDGETTLPRRPQDLRRRRSRLSTKPSSEDDGELARTQGARCRRLR